MNAWGWDATVRFVASDIAPIVCIARPSDADIPGMGGYWFYIGTDTKSG